MILTLTMAIDRPPALSKHGDIVRLDFGQLILETSATGLKNLIGTIMTQAAKQGIYTTAK